MILLYSAFLFTVVNGHGMMTSPRSRNWLATVGQDGVNTPAAGKPPAEYCTHCLNINTPTDGSCGQTTTRSYNDWLDSMGNPMSFTPQGVYNEGDIITVASYMDTHHNGHIELRFCNIGQSGGVFTPDCFDGNYLTFVEDVGVYDDNGVLRDPNDVNFKKMPFDPDYPERGYLSAGQSVGSKNTFKMTFQLPLGLMGDEILLQWRYITANSCSPEGYAAYFANNALPDSYWTPGLADKICTRQCYVDGTCTSPFNDDGSRDTYMPEQFFNCAEVKINALDPNSSTTTTTTATTTAGSTVSTTAGTTTTTTSQSGVGCCTIDFKNCSPTVEGWCSDSQANCEGPCGKWWLPNGAIVGCTARYQTCSNDSECCSPGVCTNGQCLEPATTTSTTVGSTTTAGSTTTGTPPPGSYYCNWGNGFEQPENTWCHSVREHCEGNCNGVWTAHTTTTATTTTGTTTSTSGTSSTTGTTTTTTGTSSTTSGTSSTTTTTTTASALKGLTCSPDAQVTSTVDALYKLDEFTYTVSSDPLILSLLASGGAAGGGGDVVSESQAYGLLAAALALADLDANDSLYEGVKDRFWGYFSGWKRMCENSSANASCQSTDCNGSVCLPGWKHNGDLTIEVGTGSAPDGDVDAIVGMIIGVTALEDDSLTQEWQDRVDEIKVWADLSCTSFMNHNTVLSSSGKHRLLKLGSCWGGWEHAGNNPSYHAPGHYRMMRDFQATMNSANQPSAQDWDMLIETSYKFLEIAQCPSGTGSGLVPNWALVAESANGDSLDAYPGSFSGSGTPQYEFGSEASRTMWRVVFDALAYPEQSATKAIPFLDALNDKLVDGFDPNPLNGWEYFAESSLQQCAPTVSSVFGSWIWNGFIFGPVLSTLAAYDDQNMVDEACRKVGTINQESYYPRSWLVLSTMTLNGAVAKAGELVRGASIISTTTTGTTTTATTTTTTTTTTGATTTDTSTTTTTTVSTCSFVGSKVKLNSITGQAIQAFEVQVISSSGVDVAKGSAATQSSALVTGSGDILDASNAVDGILETFSHTNDINPFWEVDLGGPHAISSVIIHNRWCDTPEDTQGCLCLLSHSVISILDENGNWVASQFIGDTCGQLEINVIFPCDE